MIKIKNLTCKYDKKIVLQDINLEIKNHISILGANGEGKSTLVKSICGLVDYEGKIKIDGIDIRLLKNKELSKKISYVGTKLNNSDEFITLWEFVLLGRYAYKKSFFDYTKQDRKKTEDVLRFLNLYQLKEQSISSLSSGETTLAMIAQAICSDTKTIIFDEPTANLDPKNSKIIARYIKELSKTHLIITVTHDLQFANFLGFDVVFIKNKQATYYRDFFDDRLLESLYGVKFDSLVPCYDKD